MAGVVPELKQGRESYAERAWLTAYEALIGADEATSLGPEDLELLATSAYMLGRDDDHVNALERAHHAHLEAGDALRAVRCAFWIGINLMLRGEMSPATGWLARAQRLVEQAGSECVEQGYLLLPVVVQQVESGNPGGGYGTAADMAEIGLRFTDPDLFSLAVHWQGYALVEQGRVEEGLALLDEAMVAVTAGEVSPIVSGLIYCSVIEACQQVYALRRAGDWTAALTRWCDQQPDMVAFTGRCLAHRAEIMQLHGAWPEALEEASRAAERLAQGMSQTGAGQAMYQRGEIQRLQGDFDAAEEAYREASRRGFEPQPGLALLRLAQGNQSAAAAAIRRAVGEVNEPLSRVGLLFASVEILLAGDGTEAAAAASEELERIASDYGSDMLRAMAAHARGAVEFASGDAQKALGALRPAQQMWQELDVPHQAARARVLLGLACRALGDDDSAELELEAARGVFASLGAAPDLARLDALARGAAPGDTHGLTPRELEVLRLVAAGETNKAIAAELVLSERTVDRHVSNILTKLRVPSRAAATAYAYEHRLV